MKFYNRQYEIGRLVKINRMASDVAQFTVLSGRRRIGKTQLMLKAFENQNFLYFFVAKKSESLLCADYQEELQNKLKIPVLGEIHSFSRLFEYIMQLAYNQKITIIIDEFQEFFSINPAVYSDMQKIWDLNKGQSKIHLITSGSVASLMHRIFENTKEPLFGRAQHIIKLKPFSIATQKEILRDYKATYQPEDLLAFYSLTGGVAKYVQLLIENEAYTKEDMIDYMINADSIFINEGKNALIEEFGRDYSIYFSILSAIASGHYYRSEIEDLLKKEIGGYLTRMERDYQLIRKAKPIFSRSSTKLLRYVLEDNFLIFWFRFIFKNHSMVQIAAFTQLRNITLRDYNTFSGVMLEKYYRTKAIESQRYTQLGSFWDRKGKIEIDFIGLNELDKSIDVAEIKRNKEKISIEKLKEKFFQVLLLYPEYKGYTINYYAWSLEDM